MPAYNICRFSAYDSRASKDRYSDRISESSAVFKKKKRFDKRSCGDYKKGDKKYASMEVSICTKIRGEGFSSLINADSERSKLQKNGMASTVLRFSTLFSHP